MIQKSGLDRVIELLDADLTYVAIGDGTAPVYTSTVLGNETFRNATSDSFIDGTTLVKELYLDESEGNGSITEVGIFGGSASATPNSGDLFSSFSTSLIKDNTESLTISFEIEVLEVT